MNESSFIENSAVLIYTLHFFVKTVKNASAPFESSCVFMQRDMITTKLSLSGFEKLSWTNGLRISNVQFWLE